MTINIDKDTKEWLQAKGKPICIQLLEVNGCCGPSVQELMTQTRTPKDIHNYSQCDVDGITFFLKKPLSPNDAIRVKRSGFSVFKLLSATLVTEN